MDLSPEQEANQQLPDTNVPQMRSSVMNTSAMLGSQFKPREDIRINQNGIGVKIVDCFQRDERFTKYTLYAIAGNDSQGHFEIARRYSEFAILRVVMITRWPGCYIPPLPPKNLIKNMETEFIKDRRMGLDAFVTKIAELPYLHYSAEYQVFLRHSGPDVTKELKFLQRVTYEDVVKRYTETFQHLAEIQAADEAAVIISRFKSFLYKAYERFKVYKLLSKEAARAKRNYYGSMAAFHDQVITEYERDVIGEYENFEKPKNVFCDTNNPQFDETVKKLRVSHRNESIEHFDNWITSEFREIEALFEAIQQKERYEMLRSKANEKNRNLNSDIQTIESGAFHWKTMLTSKSKDQKVNQIQSEAGMQQRAIEQLNILVDMIMLVLAYDEIGKFKANKSANFYALVGQATQNELDNLHNLADYWTTIQKNNKNNKH